jgi:hypothetical protein
LESHLRGQGSIVRITDELCTPVDK